MNSQGQNAPPHQSLDAVLNESSMPWSGNMSPGKMDIDFDQDLLK